MRGFARGSNEKRRESKRKRSDSDKSQSGDSQSSSTNAHPMAPDQRHSTDNQGLPYSRAGRSQRNAGSSIAGSSSTPLHNAPLAQEIPDHGMRFITERNFAGTTETGGTASERNRRETRNFKWRPPQTGERRLPVTKKRDIGPVTGENPPFAIDGRLVKVTKPARRRKRSRQDPATPETLECATPDTLAPLTESRSSSRPVPRSAPSTPAGSSSATRAVPILPVPSSANSAVDSTCGSFNNHQSQRTQPSSSVYTYDPGSLPQDNWQGPPHFSSRRGGAQQPTHTDATVYAPIPRRASAQATRQPPNSNRGTASAPFTGGTPVWAINPQLLNSSLILPGQAERNINMSAPFSNENTTLPQTHSMSGIRYPESPDLTHYAGARRSSGSRYNPPISYTGVHHRPQYRSFGSLGMPSETLQSLSTMDNRLRQRPHSYFRGESGVENFQSVPSNAPVQPSYATGGGQDQAFSLASAMGNLPSISSTQFPTIENPDLLRDSRGLYEDNTDGRYYESYDPLHENSNVDGN